MSQLSWYEYNAKSFFVITHNLFVAISKCQLSTYSRTLQCYVLRRTLKKSIPVTTLSLASELHQKKPYQRKTF